MPFHAHIAQIILAIMFPTDIFFGQSEKLMIYCNRIRERSGGSKHIQKVYQTSSFFVCFYSSVYSGETDYSYHKQENKYHFHGHYLQQNNAIFPQKKTQTKKNNNGRCSGNHNECGLLVSAHSPEQSLTSDISSIFSALVFSG